MNRCPGCQATNPAGARWCGQCLEPLGVRAPATGRAERTPAVQPGAFRRRDGAVEWACVGCGTYNPLERDACEACGTPLTARFEASGASGDTEAGTDWRAALALTVVLPGSGHVLAGRSASGFARGLLFVVWLGGGVLLAAGGGAAVDATPLLLGALAVWAATLLDVVNLSRQGPELLRPRVLVWLVVAVTAMSLAGLLARAATLV